MFQQDITMGPGTGTFASHTLEILIMLTGAFLIGLWLGWVLWNRYKQEVDKLRFENEGLQSNITALQQEITTLKDRFNAVDNERAELSIRMASAEQESQLLKTRVAEYETVIAELEALNRQYQTAFVLEEGEKGNAEAAVTRSMSLSVQPDPADAEGVAHIDDSLSPVNLPPVHDDAHQEKEAAAPPAATPENTLAKEDQPIAPGHTPAMNLTLEMQPPVATVTTETDETDIFEPVMESPTEEAVARLMNAPADEDDLFSDTAFEALTRQPFAPLSEETDEALQVTTLLTPIQADDLKIVEGIGPKIEELLFKAGIHTYSELAAAPVNRLKEILNEAGPRFSMHDPGTWSAQALLAANGEWDNLKAYQEFLNAGKRPDKK